MSMFADVIFPRVLSVYVTSILVPWLVFLALAAEFYVYYCYQRGVISIVRLIFIVLGANVCSWLFGIFLAAAIPDKWVP